MDIESMGVRMMIQTVQDKRRASRKEEAICTWLSFSRDKAAYATLTADIATEGARFSALRRVGVNDRVRIAIQLASSAILCEGKVCWVRPVSNEQYDFGVQFLNMAETDKGELQRHLAAPDA
ncbi:MAG TPA: PilZ domain-containing protein [Candidatus Hydrogenedentes bacterium]|nr:PilZ domain-containing protein [Candidatus Hydrogenedentota bacterium]HRT20977.1 PilZ domain-containing protein [Candidatus Hydrogenedentota bacterium]HRT65806.1 PilZ domain-containing protein [Candidatus Hydrogenedentota bacterium]